MFISFEQLPPSSRIWIYLSPRKLDAGETGILTSRLQTFSEGWEVHGAALPASFRIFHDQLIVLAAGDETSGCSIDTSVRVMKELGAEIGVDFLDRSLIALYKNDSLVTIPVSRLKELVRDELIEPQTKVFDSTITTLGELREKWPAPAEETWLKRFFKNTAIEKNA